MTVLGAFAERHIRVPSRVQAAVTAALVAVAVGVPVAVVMRAGGPSQVAHRFAHEFGSASSNDANLNRRLFSLSGSSRSDEWRIALRRFRDHPVAGSGAGTYELYWVRERPNDLKVRDAHSLYLEVLGELGIVGLLLVAAPLVLAAVAVVRARRSPLIPAAGAVVAAYAVHAGIDWDWEMPAVTLAAFAAAAAAIAVADEAREFALAGRRRWMALAAASVVLAGTVIAVAGNAPLAAARNALAAGRLESALTNANRAGRWMSWSPLPDQVRAEAYLGLGDRAAAHRAARAAVERDPRNWELWYDLALASVGHERTAAARRALVLNPLSPELAAERRPWGLGP